MSETGRPEPLDPVVEEPEVPPLPLLELREGLTPVVDSPAGLRATVAALRHGSGPIAIDAERASGYRYSARAYLVQLRREGSGTFLVDPIAFPDLSDLADVVSPEEWILHAASQDLPCLAEIGLRPRTLFDTELAGRLLGYPRVGLATLVETVLGRRLRKEHSAVDWSTRPLPQPWLEYAALDVEALLELRDVLAEQLEASGKAEWARQEFDALVRSTPAARRIEPWRRTSGLHRAQGRRALAAVRALWETRDSIASARDVSPTRILPDSSIVEAATRMPADRSALIGLKGFRGRGAERYASRWIQALVTARGLPDQELPGVTGRYDGPPPVRAWVDREPVAAARLAVARDLLKQVAHSLDLPVENLLTPDHVRRLMWEPPEIGDVEVTQDRVAERLRQLGAREWQVELTAEPLTQAILSGPASRAPDADSDPGLDLTDETSPEA